MASVQTFNFQEAVKCIIPSRCMFEPTQAPNRDSENARPPHCSCIAYLHSTFAVWQRPHVGLCSSHFWRRALHLVQPVKDLDMGAVSWRGECPGEKNCCGEIP